MLPRKRTSIGYVSYGTLLSKEFKTTLNRVVFFVTFVSMRYLYLLLFFHLTTISIAQSRGDIISDSLIKILSKNEIALIYQDFGLSPLLSPINYDIEVHRIIYLSPEPNEQFLTTASGLLYIPIGTCDFPVVSFQHGTTTYGNAPSLLTNDTYKIGIPFAANGYITVLADYMGYGATPDSIPHAYLHAKSEASAVIDLITAAEFYTSQNNITLNNQLFLTGYSQGGHVTMATHRELQNTPLPSFDVTASAPGAGPYELASSMKDSILLSAIYSNPFYITFTAESYHYTENTPSLRSIYNSPYDSLAKTHVDRNFTGNLPTLPWPGYQMLKQEIIDSLLNDSHSLNIAFKKNEVYNWVPLAPVNLYYCNADEQVPYTISTFTADTMTQLGAPNVKAISISESLNHDGCSLPATIQSKLWFDTFRDQCVTGISSEKKSIGSIYPTISTNGLFYSNTVFNLRLFTANGHFLQTVQLKNQQLNLSHLPNGTYYLQALNNSFVETIHIVR